MNTFINRRGVTAALVVGTLLLAACGDDDDSGGAATTAGGAPTTAGGAATTAGGAATTMAPGTTGGAATTEGGAATTTGGTGGTTGTVDLASCSGEITGSGASFPDAFYQEVIGSLADVAPDLSVTYNAIGSGSGKEEFGQNLNTFAGTDSLVEEGDGPEPGSYLYVPTTASSVTVSYNLSSVEALQLTPDLVAQIFQGQITTWNDQAIAEVNPDVELPDTQIIIAHRADGSGTTNNFTKYLDAASDLWELGSGDTVEWPADSQAGPQNTGVAQIVQQNDGAVGYVDLGDALAIGLQTASIQNQEGNFVAPSVEGTQAALAGAQQEADLTYNPLNGPGADAYPITAPTYILLRTSYDQPTFDAVSCFLTYLLTDGSELAPDVGFAPLPDEMRQKSLDQLGQVQVG